MRCHKPSGLFVFSQDDKRLNETPARKGEITTNTCIIVSVVLTCFLVDDVQIPDAVDPLFGCLGIVPPDCVPLRMIDED